MLIWFEKISPSDVPETDLFLRLVRNQGQSNLDNSEISKLDMVKIMVNHYGENLLIFKVRNSKFDLKDKFAND